MNTSGTTLLEKAAKILALPSSKIAKYEDLTSNEQILTSDKSQIMQQTKQKFEQLQKIKTTSFIN